MKSAEDLRGKLRGRLLLPGGDDYDSSRQLWNGLIDKHPGAIVQCRGVSDVVETVRFADAHGLQIAVRGGGHSVAGHAMIDGGIVIDLSGLKGVVVEREARTAWAEAGLLGNELDRETQQFGLATPLGTVSHTGISGLTLGGGYGWLSRSHGLASDNLLAANVVTADGDYISANLATHPDLFWAIRGGGGNFGIVTSFKYALHDVGPEVFGGSIAFPIADAAAILDFYRDFTQDCGDGVTLYLYFMHLDGEFACVLTLLSSLPAGDNDRLAACLRSLGTPIRDQIGMIRYSALQSMLDNDVPHGGQYYWRAGYLGEGSLTDMATKTLVENLAQLSSPRSLISLEHVGGQINRVASTETAFPHRDAVYNLLICSAWSRGEEPASHIRYAEELWQAMSPYMLGKALYQNYGSGDARAIYAGNYSRLADLKHRYDPHQRLSGNRLFADI